MSSEQHKLALMCSIEVVLMGRGNTKYNLVLAKLNSYYDCSVMDCYEHPNYLQTVLREVYAKDYDSVIDQVKANLGEIANADEVATFLKAMETSPSAASENKDGPN